MIFMASFALSLRKNVSVELNNVLHSFLIKKLIAFLSSKRFGFQKNRFQKKLWISDHLPFLSHFCQPVAHYQQRVE